MKKFNFLLAVLGVAVFFLTASRLGWENIWEQIEKIGWAILLVAAMRTASQFLFTFAWAWTIPSSARRVPFFELFRIRLAGEAINYLIPSGTLGGEPLKANLLSPSIGLANGLACVAVGKFSQVLAQLIVMVAGGLFASFTLNVPPDVKTAMFGDRCGARRDLRRTTARNVRVACAPLGQLARRQSLHRTEDRKTSEARSHHQRDPQRPALKVRGFCRV